MEHFMLLVDMISKGHFQHKIKKGLEHILRHLHIFKDGRLNFKFVVHGKHTEQCCIFFKVSSDDNILGEDITIMIKPDHDTQNQGHSGLRVIIQEGGKLVLNKSEDKSEKNRPQEKRVFKRELKAVERDVEKVLLNEILKHKKDKAA